MLVNYERLVEAPLATFRALFDFLEIPFSPSYITQVFSSSARRQEYTNIPSGVRELCDKMLVNLEALL
jgi:hypothetical protein